MIHTQYTTKKIMRATCIFCILVVLLALSYSITTGILTAQAEDQTTKAWIICQPKDYVNARLAPGTRSEIVGRFDAGDVIWVTGRTKNGFAEIDASLEVDRAWVHAGYIVFDEPEYQGGETFTVQANGRVAARKRIAGDRRCWLEDGSKVRVWWLSDEWAVTDKGFVKAEFLRR